MSTGDTPEPLLRMVDCYGVEVDDLDAALALYRDELGHPLLWRSETAAGLRMGEGNTDLVLHTDHWPEPVAIRVDSVERAVERFQGGGGSLLHGPQDIPVGRLAVVADPWGNVFTMLDLSKGRYTTDGDGNVTGLEPA
jgi:predicted enzyme related to lactoylglutathione lyase